MSFVRAIVLILLMVHAGDSCAQEVEQDYTAFIQSIDVTPWRGGEFRLSARVRVPHGTKFSHARLWARIDTERSMSFFDNMADRPIVSSEWKTYVIEGLISDKATRLVTGGICFGVDQYYYDDFQVDARRKDGDWEKLTIKNSGFEEEDWRSGWRATQQVKGFSFRVVPADHPDGGRCLLVDASSRQTDSRFVDANGISIHYKVFGAGDTLLLLHGNNESMQSFDKQVPEFSKAYHVVALDSRGQGYSSEDGKPLTYELMAEDVRAFMDRLNIRRAHLLGWSDGGNTGLILAMKYPERVRSLSVMGANLYNDDTSVEPTINKQLKKQRERLVASGRPSNRFMIELCDLLIHQPNIQPEALKAIRCPVLVMAGSRDIIKEQHTRLIASSIPDATLTIFPKGTHDEPRDNPERFNRTVLSFLKRLQ